MIGIQAPTRTIASMLSSLSVCESVCGQYSAFYVDSHIGPQLTTRITKTLADQE